jgi:polysaccharide biosynthesis protein PelE
MNAWLNNLNFYLMTHYGKIHSIWLILLALFVVNYFIASLMWYLSPKTMRVHKFTFVLLVVIFATFIPILGTLFIIVGTLLLYRFIHLFRKISYLRAVVPEYSQRKASQVETIIFSVGGALMHATSRAFSTVDRMRSLQAVNTQQNSQANAVNHFLLHDDADEIRLYAHSMLTKQEKVINSHIHDELEKYKAADNPRKKATYAKALAASYWNLVFLRLAKSDYLIEVIEKADKYAQEAIQVFGRDYTLYTLLGKLRMHEKKYTESEMLFYKALSYQAPVERIVPYLAEILYIQKKYAELKNLFLKHAQLSDMPKLNQIVAFWVKGAQQQ